MIAAIWIITVFPMPVINCSRIIENLPEKRQNPIFIIFQISPDEKFIFLADNDFIPQLPLSVPGQLILPAI